MKLIYIERKEKERHAESRHRGRCWRQRKSIYRVQVQAENAGIT